MLGLVHLLVGSVKAFAVDEVTWQGKLLLPQDRAVDRPAEVGSDCIGLSSGTWHCGLGDQCLFAVLADQQGDVFDCCMAQLIS